MWNWSDAKHALEWLFWAGLVAATHRRGSFERDYDLPERVLPHAVLGQRTPAAADARRELVARAAKALGVATADDLRDYYRLPPADARLPIEQHNAQTEELPVQPNRNQANPEGLWLSRYTGSDRLDSRPFSRPISAWSIDFGQGKVRVEPSRFSRSRDRELRGNSVKPARARPELPPQL